MITVIICTAIICFTIDSCVSKALDVWDDEMRRRHEERMNGEQEDEK